MLSNTQQHTKRFFDVVLAVFLFPIVFPLFVLLVLIATISTQQFGIFVQERIGKNGKPFLLFKIRSLKGNHHSSIKELCENETPFGHWLRKTKLDEIPQLFNVLNGTMSFVGPRPDVTGYADKLTGEDRIILMVKPGITGPATLKYKNEEALLLEQENPNVYNDEVIWPDKVKINREYVNNWSLSKDISYLWASIFG